MHGCDEHADVGNDGLIDASACVIANITVIAAEAAKADEAAVADVVDATLGLEEDDDNAGAFDSTVATSISSTEADAAAGSTTDNFASVAVTDETSVISGRVQ